MTVFGPRAVVVDDDDDDIYRLFSVRVVVNRSLNVWILSFYFCIRCCSYAYCNYCVNGTDQYKHPCEDGTYFCFDEDTEDYNVGAFPLIERVSP